MQVSRSPQPAVIGNPGKRSRAREANRELPQDREARARRAASKTSRPRKAGTPGHPRHSAGMLLRTGRAAAVEPGTAAAE